MRNAWDDMKFVKEEEFFLKREQELLSMLAERRKRPQSTEAVVHVAPEARDLLAIEESTYSISSILAEMFNLRDKD